MPFAPTQVLALVSKSMEMKLPMQVYLHEVSILNAVYGGQVQVMHHRQAEELLDGETEMQRLVKVYGANPQRQPWAEAIFGAYGQGAATLEAFYDDGAERVRADLLGDATPFPDDPQPFDNEVTGGRVIPNIGDIGTPAEAKPAAVKKKEVAAARKAKQAA